MQSTKHIHMETSIRGIPHLNLMFCPSSNEECLARRGRLRTRAEGKTTDEASTTPNSTLRMLAKMRASTVTACLAFIPSTLCQMVQVVAAGANGLSFSPSSLTAPVGSKVEFQFYAYNHSVASSSFESPCQPDGEFTRGFWA